VRRKYILPAFIVYTFMNDINLAIGLAIGAVVANSYAMIIALIESSKSHYEEEY
jgi:hypothetical protein